ncbi:MAG TPA: protein kinase, partial [Chlamydiales bacterium]|nr:protein kinase [Chlamydiales bacterium]
IFRFAAFCWTAEKTKRTGQHYHKKGCCGLHHPVLIDWSQRFIYPIARREKSALYESGSGKVVINALGVPFDSFDPKRIVQAVRAVPKIAKLPSNAKDQKSVQGSNQDLIQSFKKEIRMYSALKKAPYIMPLLASYEKPEAFISKKGPPILLITKKAEFGNLYDALKYHTINRQQCIHALVLCLKEFHELGLIHSDIKCQNILIDKEGNLFLSDFETSFSTNQLPIEPHFTFTENYYPAKWYCAPELLLRDKKLPPFHETATGREYQLVESFAVGCVAYLLHFDKEADWVKRIKRIVAKLGFSYLFTQRQEKWIHDKMKACIEEPLLQLPQQAEKRSRKEHLCWAIFNLMRMDPKVRWDLATAHNYLQQYVAL